jgi:hypothetical protein
MRGYSLNPSGPANPIKPEGVTQLTAPAIGVADHAPSQAAFARLEVPLSQDCNLERAAIVACTLLQKLHRVLADPDEVTRGVTLGTAMFCDEAVGPFHAKRLTQAAPDVVLQEAVHVADDMASVSSPVLAAFGKHLLELATQRRSPVGEPEVTAA